MSYEKFRFLSQLIDYQLDKNINQSFCQKSSIEAAMGNCSFFAEKPPYKTFFLLSFAPGCAPALGNFSLQKRDLDEKTLRYCKTPK